MELTKIIKELEAIKKDLNNINRYDAEEATKKINNFILDLKTEILNTSTTGTLNKNRNKKLTAWHKKQLKSCRSILAYSTIYNNYQVFTDSYFMVALADPDKTELIPDYKNHSAGYTYPVVNRIINNAVKALNDTRIFLDIEKLIAMLKINEKVYIKLFDNILHVVNKEAFNNLITFLNIASNADIKKISFDKHILYIETKTGSFGLVQTILNDNKATADNTIIADV